MLTTRSSRTSPAVCRTRAKAAIGEAVPAAVLTSALHQRFNSRGEADFQNKLLSAMRLQFGGHVEKKG